MIPAQRLAILERAVAPFNAALRARRRHAENAWWTEADRLADADAALWRCSCGAWRFGSRDCGTCAALRTAVAA